MRISYCTLAVFFEAELCRLMRVSQAAKGSRCTSTLHPYFPNHAPECESLSRRHSSQRGTPGRLLRPHEPGSPAPFRFYEHLVSTKCGEGAPRRHRRTACAGSRGPVEGPPSAAIGRGARTGCARQRGRRYARECRVRPRVCLLLAPLDRRCSCHAPTRRNVCWCASRGGRAGLSDGFPVRCIWQHSRRSSVLSSACVA